MSQGCREKFGNSLKHSAVQIAGYGLVWGRQSAEDTVENEVGRKTEHGCLERVMDQI